MNRIFRGGADGEIPAFLTTTPIRNFNSSIRTESLGKSGGAQYDVARPINTRDWFTLDAMLDHTTGDTILPSRISAWERRCRNWVAMTNLCSISRKRCG